MRTKEEIIEALDWRTNDEGTPFTYNNLETAMDEYAKEVAIDYCHWVMKRAFPHLTKEEQPLPEDQQLFEKYQQEKSSLK